MKTADEVRAEIERVQQFKAVGNAAYVEALEWVLAEGPLPVAE